jgi:hypothetical protein
MNEAPWRGEVTVRFYPLTEATPAALKTLGNAVNRWLKDGPQSAGFLRAEEHEGGGVEALKAGELPLPEALAVSNAFRDARRRHPEETSDDDPVAGIAKLSPRDILDLLPHIKGRPAVFTVHGVDDVQGLFESLNAWGLCMPAVSRLEFSWFQHVGDDMLQEMRRIWFVNQSAA